MRIAERTLKTGESGFSPLPISSLSDPERSGYVGGTFDVPLPHQYDFKLKQYCKPARIAPARLLGYDLNRFDSRLPSRFIQRSHRNGAT